MRESGILRDGFTPGFAEMVFSSTGSRIAEQITWVSTILFAYSRSGAKSAGLFASAILLVAAILTPLATRWLERFTPFSAALTLFSLQSVTAFATATMAIYLPEKSGLVWVGLGCMVVLVSITPPIVAAILPEIARGGSGLAAQNVILAWTENVARIVGPLLTAGLLSFSANAAHGVALTFSVSGAIFGLSALALVNPSSIERSKSRAIETPTEETDTQEFVRSLRDVGPLKTLLLLTLSSYLILGSLDVLYVPIAADSGFGTSGAGILAGAYGFGGLITFGISNRILGRPKLTPALCVFAIAGSLPLVVLAFYRSNNMATVVVLALVGALQSIFAVVRQMLVQRCAPPGTFLRVTGIFQGAVTLGYAFGSLIPWVSGSVTRSCIVTGLMLPMTLLAVALGLRSIDGEATVPLTEIALLSRVSIMRSLRPASLEALARHSHVRKYRSGLQIVHEGDIGQEMFVIIDGHVEVTHDERSLASLSRGEIFGEVAVLRDQPRNATVHAVSDVQLLAIPRADFVNFVGLHQWVAIAVDAVIEERTSAVL
jgi:MFS family permease